MPNFRLASFSQWNLIPENTFRMRPRLSAHPSSPRRADANDLTTDPRIGSRKPFTE